MGSLNLLDATTFVGVLAGILSFWYPFFRGLTVVLAALSFVIWMIRVPGSGYWSDRYRRRIPMASLGAVALVAFAGWFAFFALPSSRESFGGLALSSSVVILWCYDRKLARGS